MANDKHAEEYWANELTKKLELYESQARDAMVRVKEDKHVSDDTRLGVLASANTTILDIASLRKDLARGNVAQAVLAAIGVGQMYERISRVWGQDFTVAGCKAYNDRSNARGKKEADAKAQRKAIVKAVHQRLKGHPADSVDYARHRVAEAHGWGEGMTGEDGWSYGSIRRATLGMKKPKCKLAHSGRVKIDVVS